MHSIRSTYRIGDDIITTTGSIHQYEKRENRPALRMVNKDRGLTQPPSRGKEYPPKNWKEFYEGMRAK